MGEIINYINGEWLPASGSRVSFSDGGFQRGDGLFETIRFKNGRLFKPEKHMKRLHSGLNIIQIEFHKSNTETNLKFDPVLIFSSSCKTTFNSNLYCHV